MFQCLENISTTDVTAFATKVKTSSKETDLISGAPEQTMYGDHQSS